MKVLVTGGSGNVGGYVLDELVGKHEITVLDTKASLKHPDLPFININLMDASETLNAVKGFDAVVHLAAIPNPSKDPVDRVLHVNTLSTYNLMEAVRLNGIPRVVYASSESASGFGIHNVSHKPMYLPIDERHPSWPHETYSLSKYFGEVICQEYAHAYGIKVIALRYTWVWFREDGDSMKNLVKHVQANGGDGFGAYVFAEDVAQAFKLSLDYTFTGDEYFQSFYITADDALITVNDLDQIMKIYPTDGPPIDGEYFGLHPQGSFFSIEKAKRLLGYKPQHNWKELL
ncbi:MAG: NAD-dependent epimerase/dehydratase family protein [Armatimonadota bacterium]